MTDYWLVSGEGVVLDARPAGFATRALAAGIDLATLALFGWLAAILAGNWLGGLAPQWSQAGLVAAIVLLLVGIPTLIETLTRGYSLGKWVLGIRVVRDDGGAIGFRHALIRAMLGVGEIWLTTGIVALISSLASPNGKRLGDALAGTYVLRVRDGGRHPALRPVAYQVAPPMPARFPLPYGIPDPD